MLILPDYVLTISSIFCHFMFTGCVQTELGLLLGVTQDSDVLISGVPRLSVSFACFFPLSFCGSSWCGVFTLLGLVFCSYCLCLSF